MAQKSENYKFEGKYSEYIPIASVDQASGDVVQLRRDTGYIEVMAATLEGFRNFVGILDDKWNNTVATQRYGAGQTDYSSPSTRPVKLKVYHSGVFDLAIRETSGKAGQAVYLLTATSGAQVFTIDPLTAESVAGPLGYLYEAFSGAVANDVQEVRVTAGIQTVTPDIRWYLMNHIVAIQAGVGASNTYCAAESIAGTASYCPSFFPFLAMVQGKLLSVQYGSAGTVSAGGASDAGCCVAGHQVFIWALASDGTILGVADRAKASDVASACLRGNSIYWPSVTIDYFPFAMGLGKHSTSYLTSGGHVFWFQRSICDVMKVT